MNETILKWGSTSSFIWLAAAVALAAAYFYFEKRSQLKLHRAFGEKVAAYLAQSVSIKRRRFQLALQIIAIVFIVIAMARPQAGESQQEIKSEGVELMIVADVSDSMRAEDVKPSRLSFMKIEMARLLDLIPGNKIGIIAFAGSSALLSPLTSDPNALRMYIDSLDVNSVSSQGTVFETALNHAKEAFDRGGVTQDNQSRTTRAVLVVSDGEDQEQGALEVVKKMSDEGIKVFTMAYGTEKGAGIPELDRFGNAVGFKKDDSGQTVLTQVRGDFLKQMAQSGGGKFYFAEFDGNHLKQFVADLNELEKTQFQSSINTQYEEKFTLPLLIGIILLIISLLIHDRNGVSSEWKGRYET